MTDIINPMNFFWKLGYRQVTPDIYFKSYPQSYNITVNLAQKTIDYGNKIQLCNKAIASFSQINYVIAECIDRLLVKGYLPSDLFVGFAEGADIAIKDEAGWKTAIRCRRWDNDEYDREVKSIITHYDRPAITDNVKEHFRFLCIYASTLRSGLIDYGTTIFPLSNNCVMKDGGKIISSATGLFEGSVKPYDILIPEKVDGKSEAQTVETSLSLGEFVIKNSVLTQYRGSDKTVVVPLGVKKLQNGVFWDHPEIREVILPESVTSLGGETFADCTNLMNLTIPPNVLEIGDNPFSNCPILKLENKSPNFVLEDGVLYDREKSRLIYYPISKTNNSFEIPNGVVSIGKHAIQGCSTLRKIVIPPSAAIVENNPFASCPALTLENHSPNFILDDYALYDGNKTSIFYFAINSPLKSFAIPEGVATIQRHSFFGCVGLSSVTIPSSIKVIGYNPFANCPSLTLVNHSSNFVYEDGILYDQSKTTLKYYSIGNLRKEFVIPNTIRTIGRNAFFGCNNLSSIIIPEGVESIDKGAFAYCTGLKKVEVTNNVKSIGNWAFYGCSKLTALKVPKHTSIADHAFSRCPVKLTRF